MFKGKSESSYEEEDVIHLGSLDTDGEDCDFTCGKNCYKTKKSNIAFSAFSVWNTWDACGKRLKKNEWKGRTMGKGQRNNMAILCVFLYQSETDI